MGNLLYPQNVPFTVKTGYFVLINQVSVGFFNIGSEISVGPGASILQRLVRNARGMKDEREAPESSAEAYGRRPVKRAECPALCSRAPGTCGRLRPGLRGGPPAGGSEGGRAPSATLRSLCLRSELIGWFLFSWL